MIEELLTPKEVAEMLKVSRRGVVLWITKGKLKAVKVGSQWRIRMSDVQDFIKEVQ